MSLVLAVALLVVGNARGDGAFPDSDALFLPRESQDQVLLATNFGLVRSDDGGETFRVLCEAAIGPNATLYQRSPLPGSRILTVATDGLYRSDLQGCGFTRVRLGAGNVRALDAFPDAVVAGRLWVVAVEDSHAVVLRSDDDAEHFGPPLLVGPDGSLPTGIEASQVEVGVAYVVGTWPDDTLAARQVIFRLEPGEPVSSHDVSSVTKGRPIRLIAVDPVRPGRLLLRIIGPSSDQVAIADDGGQTIRVLPPFAGRVRAFLRRSDGVALLGDDAGGLWQLGDDLSVRLLNSSVHPRALAERDGLVYVAADPVRDGYALGRSRDGGRTVEPWFRFAELCGLSSCPEAATACVGALDSVHAIVGDETPNECRTIDGGIPPGVNAVKSACNATPGSCSRATAIPLGGIALGVIVLMGRKRRGS